MTNSDIFHKSVRFADWIPITYIPQLYWSWRQDSNPRPSDYKSLALPTELRQHSTFNGAGNGTRTRNLQLGRLSLYQLSYSRIIHLNVYHTFQYLVARVGFEPTKAMPTDLQSVPFGHSGISPHVLSINKRLLISTFSHINS